MDFDEAEPGIGEWWIVALHNSSNRTVQYVTFIYNSIVHFGFYKFAVNTDHIDWIAKIDLWDEKYNKGEKSRILKQSLNSLMN